jgi:hypothetical protein
MSDGRRVPGEGSVRPSSSILKAGVVALLTFLLGSGFLAAQGRSLFFLEIQGVAAYSSAGDRVEFASLMTTASMQKPSLGFDFVQRISGKNRDVGVLALQARLALNDRGEKPFELQLHNAYFRWKAGFADVWAGHNRPPLGLSYSLDNHALLLPSPAMTGFGYDRDWGVGLHRDFSWGDGAAALTAGTGMPLHLKGNFLATLRVSRGVLVRDNRSFGLSLAIGRVLETMGLEVIDDDPSPLAAAAADGTFLWRNLEGRVEALVGRKSGQTIAHFFWRGGLNLLEEGRLKLELQPAVRLNDGIWDTLLAGGASVLVSPALTARAMVLYDHARHDTRYVLQIYYYRNL